MRILLALTLSVLGCGKGGEGAGKDPPAAATPSGPVEHAATAAPVPDPGPPPDSLPPPAREAFDKMMAVYDEYGAAASGNAGDCNKVAAAIREVTSKRTSEIAYFAERRRRIESDQAAAAWFAKAYQPRIDAAVAAMKPAMSPCLSSSAEIGYAIHEAPLPQKW